MENNKTSKIENIGLSNTTYEINNLICKKYNLDEFQKTFGNNEHLILGKLERKFQFKFYDTLCYQKIKGINVENYTNDQIISIAKELSKFNNLSLVSKIPNYKDCIKKLFKKYPKLIENEKKIIKKGIKLLKNKKERVLLHGDLVFGNILINNKEINFIDFEYSGDGNYYFDLASFSTERKISLEQEKLFIDSYLFENEKFKEQFNYENYKLAKLFLLIFTANWALWKFNKYGKEIFKEIYGWKKEMIYEINK